MTGRWRLARIAIGAGCALGLFGITPVAQASTVRIGLDADDLGVLTFTGAPGERNTVSAVETDAGTIVTDSTALIRSAGRGCRAYTAHKALCDGSYYRFHADLGDGNDVLSEAPFSRDSTIHGGPGDDTITANSNFTTIYGDEGDDTLRGGADGGAVIHGGPGSDHITGFGAPVQAYGEDGDDVIGPTYGNLDGGPGDDTLSTVGLSGGETTSSRLQGGDGDDTLLDGATDDELLGGTGFDTVSYASRTTPVVATIGGALSGSGDELDTIAPDVERLVGGSADDTLIGSDRADVLVGGEGDDGLSGGLGNDTLDGGPGNDSLSGSAGDDTVLAGPGADRVWTNSGADTVHTEGDATADTVDCGQTGTANPQTSIDHAFYDLGLDRIANCEDLHPIGA